MHKVATLQPNSRRYHVWLAATAIVTVCGLVFAAGTMQRLLAIVAAGMFALVVAIVTVMLNNRVAAASNNVGSSAGAANAATHNAALIAIVFGWGGSAILGAYYLTDLFWHHAWQYGIAMCVVAGLVGQYSSMLARGDNRLSTPVWLARSAWLALAQAVAAAAGLTFLILSGKLARHNNDWIANHVFVAGGLAIIIVSIVAFLAQRPTSRRI